MMNFDFETLKALAIPEGDVIKIERGNEILWEKAAEFKNLLPLATDTDRKTIYQGKGYRTGYRLSSSGSVAAQSGMCASGFIPCKSGDILRIKGIQPKAGTSSYVITYNSSNTKVAHGNLGQSTTTPLYWIHKTHPLGGYGCIESYENDILTIPLDSATFGTNFDALRFSAGVINENTIVTINQEIPA